MTNYNIYDTNGKLRDVSASVSPEDCEFSYPYSKHTAYSREKSMNSIISQTG